MRRVMVVFLAAMCAVIWPVAPGHAVGSPEAHGTFTKADPRHDAVNDRGAGDITSLQVVHGSTVKLTTSVRRGVNPSTSAAYQEQGSFVVWYLQLDDDPFQDAFRWEINLTGDGQGHVTGFFNHGGSPVACAVTRTAAGDTYRVKFARSCLGNPTSIRVQTRTFYRPMGTAVLDSTFDQCPSNGAAYTQKVLFSS